MRLLFHHSRKNMPVGSSETIVAVKVALTGQEIGLSRMHVALDCPAGRYVNTEPSNKVSTTEKSAQVSVKDTLLSPLLLTAGPSKPTADRPPREPCSQVGLDGASLPPRFRAACQVQIGVLPRARREPSWHVFANSLRYIQNELLFKQLNFEIVSTQPQLHYSVEIILRNNLHTPTCQYNIYLNI